MKVLSIVRFPALVISASASVALIALAGACQEQTPVAPHEVAVQAAKGGGGGGPRVTGTDPTGAAQGTTLSVRVFGSRFDNGSTVELTLGGVGSPKVTTNSTQFVSSSELIADVTIEADATEGAYDVEVQATNGKKGIGVELFAINSNGGGNSGGGLQEPIAVVFTGDVISDGRLESFRDPATDSETQLKTFANVLAGTGSGGTLSTSFGELADLSACVGDVDLPGAGDALQTLNAGPIGGSGHGVEVELTSLGEESSKHATGATYANTTFGSLTGDFIVKIRECPGGVRCPKSWGDPVATIIAGPTTDAATGEISTTYRFTGGQVTVWYRPAGNAGNGKPEDSIFIACQMTAGHYVDAEVIENAVVP